MTARRLRVLIQRLPPESATMTALRNAMTAEELAEQAGKGEPEKGRWSQAEQLLALVVDRVARLEHITLLANTGKGSKKPTPPEPVRRPGAQPPKPKPKLTGTGADWLFHMINGGAA
ncbi:hypothetical protein ACIQFU_23190 [Streptomyces sp. NPDC093065]|uniref:hypothetical protein n=1 Tax=Streptomyces sp. NPDC093065 TaxID=3366021 RepID=UPI003823EBA8